MLKKTLHGSNHTTLTIYLPGHREHRRQFAAAPTAVVQGRVLQPDITKSAVIVLRQREAGVVRIWLEWPERDRRAQFLQVCKNGAEIRETGQFGHGQFWHPGGMIGQGADLACCIWLSKLRHPNLPR